LYNTVHIFVATPGRVLDLANKGVCDLSKCNILILDEVYNICIEIRMVLTYSM
jgi:superfamily II DNA/RNA helicase